MRTSKSRSKQVAKISCNKVCNPVQHLFLMLRVFSMNIVTRKSRTFEFKKDILSSFITKPLKNVNSPRLDTVTTTIDITTKITMCQRAIETMEECSGKTPSMLDVQ